MKSKREAIRVLATAAIFSGVTLSAGAEESEPVNPSAVRNPVDRLEKGAGSDAVTAGGLVFVSGQVGFDENGNYPADPEQQYRLAFAAVDEVLKKAGLSRSDLVELVTFHTNYPQHMDVFMAVKKQFLNGVRPTWTAIGVAALGHPGALVEIKATARAR